MLRPVPMRQLSIIVQKEQLHNLLVYAGQQHVLHLISVAEKFRPEGAERYDASNLLARSSAVRNRILTLTSTLSVSDAQVEKAEAPVQDLNAMAEFLDKETSKIEHVVRGTEDSAAKLQIERERAQELARFLTGLESVGISLDVIGGNGFLTLLAGEIVRESVPDVRKALDDLTYGNLIFAVTGSAEKTQTFLAVFPSPFQEEAKQTITALGAKPEPSWADLPTDPGEAQKVIYARLEQIGQALNEVEQERRVRVKELGPKIKGLNVLSEILDIRARALSGSLTTQATCMLQAWVPEDRVQQFTEGSAGACNGLASVHSERSVQHGHGEGHGEGQEVLSATGEETPPTLVRVPRWAQPLQSIVNNFGTPSYNEINPLPFMIVSYPLIFGLMFGDFGQGPLFILFGLLLLRVKRKGAKVPGGDIGQLIVGSAELMILLGIGITIFGFVFGDFFGFESAAVFGFHPIFTPTEGALSGDIQHLQEFMVIILYFGVAHYTFGLSLSAYMKLRRQEYSEAFFGPVCWAWFYLVLVYLVRKFALAGYDFSVIVADPVSIALFLVPLVLMGWKEGGLHALEAFTSAGSNTLSYLRIWALNIADFFVKVALFTAFGIGGAVAGNLLVMIIEGLIVFVQTLRLHWVEWFSKFYEGSGRSFAPYQEPTSWIVPISG